MNRSVSRLLPAVAAFPFILLTNAASYAEPVEVVIESVRFDCSRCPDVFDRYERMFEEDSSVVNVAMQAVEKAAVKHMVFRHTQWIEPERRVRQTTQMHDSTLVLDLLVRSADGKSFTVQFDAKFSQHREGAEHDAQQGSGTTRCGTTLTCALGGTIFAGGLVSRAESPGNPSQLEVCAVRVGLKNIDPGGLAEPEGSEVQPKDCPAPSAPRP